MSATTVNGQLLGPLVALPAGGVQVTVTLVDYDDAPAVGFNTADSTEILAAATIVPTSGGLWTAQLVPNADIQLFNGLAQTAYRVTETGNGSAFTYWIVVTASMTPLWVGSLRTTLVGTSGGSAAAMAIAGGLTVGGAAVFNGAVTIPTGASIGDVWTCGAGGAGSWQPASSAGSTVFSRQLVVAADGVPSVVVAPVGVWTPTYLMTSDTGGVWSGWINASDGAQNDAVSFDFACGAGTYELELRHLAYTNRGTYTVKIDGVSVGTVDGYAASLTAERSTLTGIALAAGTHVVTLLMATKNASSISYFGFVERLMFTRTA